MADKCIILPGGQKICPQPNLFQSGYLGKQPYVSLKRPTDFDGLTLWLDDPAIPSNIIEDGSNRVSQWTDISGNGNNFVQSTGADQPLRSGSDIIFDGSAEFMQSNANVANFNDNVGEFFFVIDDSAGTGVAFTPLALGEIGTDDNRFEIRISGSNQINLRKELAGSLSITTSAAITRDIPMILSISSDGSNYIFEQNGNDVAPGANDNGIWISDNPNFDTLALASLQVATPIYDIVNLRSVLYYNRQLTTLERGQVTTYLNARFSLGL